MDDRDQPFWAAGTGGTVQANPKVTIPLQSTVPTEGTVSPAQLFFDLRTGAMHHDQTNSFTLVENLPLVPVRDVGDVALDILRPRAGSERAEREEGKQ